MFRPHVGVNEPIFLSCCTTAVMSKNELVSALKTTVSDKKFKVKLSVVCDIKELSGSSLWQWGIVGSWKFNFKQWPPSWWKLFPVSWLNFANVLIHHRSNSGQKNLESNRTTRAFAMRIASLSYNLRPHGSQVSTMQNHWIFFFLIFNFCFLNKHMDRCNLSTCLSTHYCCCKIE